MTDWFRSWHGAPTDPKWLGIARRAGVAPGIVVAAVWSLMDRASQAADRGSITGYDAEGMACFFGCEPEAIEAIVAAMSDKGIIVNGRFASWEKRQPKREDDSSQRVREHRERKRAQSERVETRCNATEEIREEQKEEEHPSPPSVVRPPQKTRGEFLPKDWKPNAEGQRMAIAAMGGRDAAWGQLERFRDHWLAKSGADGRKRDWDAAWRNWIRNAVEYEKRNGNYQRQHRPASGPDNAIAALDQLLGGGSGGGGGPPVSAGYDDAERDAAGVYRIPH